MVVLIQLTMVQHQLLSSTIPDDTASQHDTRSVGGAITSGYNNGNNGDTYASCGNKIKILGK